MNRRKIIDFCRLVVAVMLVSISTVFAAGNLKTETTDSADCIVDTYQNITEYEKESAKDQKYISQGYIYAGSFTDKSCTAEYALKASDIEGPVYVKYVPKEILGLKAQVSANLWNDNNKANDETGAIRFVTSVDSLAYKKVGFKITVGASQKVNEKSSNTVYKQLYVNIGKNDATGEMIPPEKCNPQQEFHSSSEFFKTWTVTSVTSKDYGTEFKVTPFWVTLDGIEVTGTQSIKTVNGGRTWEYVFVDDSGDDTKGAGIQQKPYRTLEKALSEMQKNKTLQIEAGVPGVNMTGNVYVLNSLTTGESFAWNEHGLAVTILGDKADKASVVDFSGIQDMNSRDNTKDLIIGDGVTFSNMTLKYQAGRVFANGHKFVIDADVISENPQTTIHGGSCYAASGSTDVTILSGRYRAVYGGGCVGNVNGDTKVTLKNTTVYSTTKEDAKVCGGCLKGTVTGNTSVTIGAGFNQEIALDYDGHSHYSTVCGGGFSAGAPTSVVEGDTHVYFEEGAKADYVYGGGHKNSIVKGICNVEFSGGETLSINGGSYQNGENAGTFVKMTGGTVMQIYGGNQVANVANGLTTAATKGNTNVQVLGGTVTRRIYGGCYNDYELGSGWQSEVSVSGNTNVTIGPNAKLGIVNDTDNSIAAVSRRAANADTETGIMVLHEGQDRGKLGFKNAINITEGLYTNYLITAGTGGLVTAEDMTLQITPDKADGYAIVTDKEAGKSLCILQGKGSYQLPEVTDRTKIHEIEVRFSDTADLTGFAVKNIKGTETVYYTSLENAVAAAEDDTKIVVLEDVTVNNSMTISKNITLISEKAVTITRGDAFTNGSMFDITGGTFSVKGTSAGQITIDGNAGEDTTLNVRGFYAHSSGALKLEYATVKNFRTTGDGGAVRVAANSQVDVRKSKFEGNYAGVGGAIHIVEGAVATVEYSAFTGNHSMTNGNGGAIYCKGTYKDTNSSYTGNVSGRHGGAIIAQPGAMVTLIGNTAEAKFSGNAAAEKFDGAAIYVNDATVTITGYVFEDGTQKIWNGGTIVIDKISIPDLVMGTKGKIRVDGYAATNSISLRFNEYADGKEVLIKGEGVEDAVFEAACKGLKLVEKQDWYIDAEGKLRSRNEARIGDTKYQTLSEAVTAASAEDVIYVLSDVKVNSKITINKNVTITNEPGKDVTLTRTTNVTVFNVSSGALTLGTNDGKEQGKFIVDGGGAVATDKRIVENQSGATFILGKNAILQNADNGTWGNALINRGTGIVELYGTVKDNTCSGDGGAILQHGKGKLTVYEGTYTGNKSTNTGANAWGAVIKAYAGTVEIKGGTFSDNRTVKLGSVLYVKEGANVIISGGTFKDNRAGEGGAIYSHEPLQVAGEITAANGMTVTPSAYTEGASVLTKAEGVTDEVFKAACEAMQVTADAKGKLWELDENGCLSVAKVARIGGTKYETLDAALVAAKADDVIYVRNNVEIGKKVTIDKNLTITNEPGRDVTITRSTSMESGPMFYVQENTKAVFTIGTNIENEQGKIVVADNGVYKNKDNTRIVDNRAGATFILEKNAVLQGANSNQRGSALVNRGTAALYGSVKDNICTGDGGAILQVSGTLTVYEGTYTGNQATKVTVSNTQGGLGSVITAIGGTTEIKGGTFSDNTTKSRGVIHAVAAATVRISGGIFKENTVAEGGVLYCYGTLQVAGEITAANGITVTPSSYAKGASMLTKADGVTDEVFKAACKAVKVTPDADGKAWELDENGCLSVAKVARIGETKYETLEEALTAANKDDVIYVMNDVKINSKITIDKAVTITNEPGKSVTIMRGAGITDRDMFVVSGGAKLTLGTNEVSEEGTLIVDGATAKDMKSRSIQNVAGATFVLGKNAILQNANSTDWGTALNNAGRAELYGTIKNNTSTTGGGAVLQSNAAATLLIDGATLTGNQAVRPVSDPAGGSAGSAIIVNKGTVEIKNATFLNNSTTGRGGAVYVYPEATAVITGGTFKGNTAGVAGNAIYIPNGGTVTVAGATFETEGQLQDICVEGTLKVAGKIVPTGGMTVTPSNYAEGTSVLTKADGVIEEVFKAACKAVKVTKDAEGNAWTIDESGCLKQVQAARIGEMQYETLEDALVAANAGDVIYVLDDVEINNQITIDKAVTITNEPGRSVVIARGAGIAARDMFVVSGGATLTLGTNEVREEGNLIVDGATAETANTRIIQNTAGATFVLGKNAILQNANSNTWGTALNNAGNAELYGTIKNNICTAGGGAVIQSGTTPTLLIDGAVFTGNQAVRPASDVLGVSAGSAIIIAVGTSEIKNATFMNNSTTGSGGAISVSNMTTVTITGGTFKGNTAGVDGNAIYVSNGGTVTVDGATFETGDPAQEICVDGTLNYSGVPDALILGTGTKNKK